MRRAAEDVRTDNPTVTAGPVRGKKYTLISIHEMRGVRTKCKWSESGVYAGRQAGWLLWLPQVGSDFYLPCQRWCSVPLGGNDTVYNSLLQPELQPTHAETNSEVCDFFAIFLSFTSELLKNVIRTSCKIMIPVILVP